MVRPARVAVVLFGATIVFAGAFFWRHSVAITPSHLAAAVETPTATSFSRAFPLAARIPSTPRPRPKPMTTAEILAARDSLVITQTRLVEIDLTHQIMTAWENGGQIWTTPISTGKSSTPTRPGVWSVLDKKPMAWGEGLGSDGSRQVWGMPYWLGIYLVDETENGIHELPLINGLKEGPRDLGHPVSHGCVRVSHEQAPILYTWAVIGMPVVIHY